MVLNLIDENLETDLDIMLMLKVKEFRNENFRNINKEILKDYLINIKWKKRDKLAVCDLANDIFDVTASEVFDYLKTQDIKRSSRLSIEDFSDLISK